MTDNEEIIQEATEAVEKNLNAGCYVGELLRIVKGQKTEIAKKDTEIGILIRKKEALRDEIAEQQAEIERLQKEKFDSLNSQFAEMYATTLKIATKKAKSEAYREFAERLKDVPSIIIAGQKHYVIVETYFDNTLNELTRNLHGTCTESNE